MPRDIGIDLGQTNSKMAWLGGAEGPQILLNSDNERLTPTLVAVGTGGQFLAGREALGMAAANPERVTRDLVARLASGGPVTLEGKSYRPESLVAFFLRKLKADAEARLRDTVSRAFVAVPPTWDAETWKRLCDSGAEAGLAVVPVDSSLAAAWAAGVRQPSDCPRYLLVYDLGGTNFTVAVLALEGASLSIRKTATLQGVGGAGFDQLLVDYVVTLIEERHHVDPRLHGRFMTALYRRAEQAKILLGAHRSTDVRIAGMLRSASGAPLDVDVEIERDELERMLEDQVRSTLQATQNVLGEAGVPLGQVDAVILTGGSTSIPAVRSAVQEFVGAKKVVQDVDPLEVIALGAAWMSGSPAVQPQPADPASVVVVAAGPQAPPPAPAPGALGPAPGGVPARMVEAWRGLDLAREQGALDEAIELYDQFIGLAREDLSGLYERRAAQLLDAGKEVEAVALLQKGFECWPANTAIGERLGDYYLRFAASSLEGARRARNRREFKERADFCERYIGKSLEYLPRNPRAAHLSEQLRIVRRARG